jgi:signal transduction histidine kinase
VEEPNADGGGLAVDLHAKVRDLEERLRRATHEADLTRARLDTVVAATLDQSVCLEFEPPVRTSLPPEEQVDRMLEVGVVVALNDFAAQRFGGRASAADIAGKRLMDVMERARLVFREQLLGFVHAGYRQDRHEYVLADADGNEVDIELNRYGTVADGMLVRMWSVSRDVTERKRRDERMQQARKLESLGMLAGGIAHDFNNLLMVLCASADVMKRNVARGKPVDESIATIEEGLGRATALVRQILTFSQQTEGRRAPTALAPIVAECGRLVAPSLPAGVALDTAGLGPCRAVAADAAQMHQVVMNLVTNAAQAIEGAGRIEVTLAEVELDHAGAAELSLCPGVYAKLVVRDTGMGMAAKTRERIFDPFFTTKAPGKGTGLGLSVVHGIVTAHGGVVRVTSRPGAGATFEVLVPIAG